jgi:pyrroloquinoline quinone (PQQ) biosynthesis protein C
MQSTKQVLSNGHYYYAFPQRRLNKYFPAHRAVLESGYGNKKGTV